MKTATFTLMMCILASFAFTQSDTLQKSDTSFYRIVKTDGSEILGQIIKKDKREVLVMTEDGREIFIPQYVIKEIIPIQKEDYNSNGKFVGEDKFATRYFITTNGLPVKKGEHYVQWNLFGPDFQFGVGENLGVGVMTSWVGIPIIGTIKKSFQLGEKSQLAVGALVGTGSWALPRFGGALPYVTLSFGSRRANIAFSGGYGAIWGDGNSVGRGLASIAGMVKVAPKISIVFDSFILLPNQQGNSDMVSLIIPGIRWHQEEGKAFQFGFAGVAFEGDVVPIPVPMVQWYRSL
jgi:hypothetical protein